MKNNKKGFTIVELVIVIAVIGILAAVLIPTFTNVVANAHKAAAQEEGRNVIVAYMAENEESQGTLIGFEEKAKTDGWIIYEKETKTVGYGYNGDGYVAIFSADGNYIATVETETANNPTKLVDVTIDGNTPFTGWTIKTPESAGTASNEG